MALEDFSKSVHIDTGNKAILTVNWEKASKNPVYTFWLIGSEAIFTPTHHTAHLLAKREQRSFCTAQILASFGVKLAYGVISAGNLAKEKPEISRIIKKFQDYIGKLLLNRLHRGDCSNLSRRNETNHIKTLFFVLFGLHFQSINLQKCSVLTSNWYKFGTNLVQNWYRVSSKKKSAGGIQCAHRSKQRMLALHRRM